MEGFYFLHSAVVLREAAPCSIESFPRHQFHVLPLGRSSWADVPLRSRKSTSWNCRQLITLPADAQNDALRKDLHIVDVAIEPGLVLDFGGGDFRSTERSIVDNSGKPDDFKPAILEIRGGFGVLDFAGRRVSAELCRWWC